MRYYPCKGFVAGHKRADNSLLSVMADFSLLAGVGTRSGDWRSCPIVKADFVPPPVPKNDRSVTIGVTTWMAMFVDVCILAAVDITTEGTTHLPQPVHEIPATLCKPAQPASTVADNTSYTVAKRFPRCLGRQDILEPCLQAS